MPMENLLTQLWIEPVTFRFVEQHLNHCATAVPTIHSITSQRRRTKNCSCFNNQRYDHFNRSEFSVYVGLNIVLHHAYNGRPGRSIGMATGYGAGRSGDRIPVGTRFSAPVQTGPVTHPASCTMGTGSFPGVKSGGDVTLIPHPF